MIALRFTSILILFLFPTLSIFGQIPYNQGYLISTNGDTTKCLIKNYDWKSNPNKFEYKLSEDGAKLVANYGDVREVTISNFTKFVAAFVPIDRSSEKIGDLGTSKKPDYEDEELFLKVLIEGEANLYSYVDGSLRRYFFKSKSREIEPLVYKKYKSEGNELRENNRFKQQLLNQLNCPKPESKNTKYLRYTKGDLLDYFKKYHKCIDTDYIIYKQKSQKNNVQINLRPGVSFSSLEVNSFFAGASAIFDREINLRFGLESEFYLPFHNTRWAILIEPTYQSFKAESDIGPERIIEYSSIELPIGLRHYFFLNDNSHLFINGAYIFDLNMSTKYAQIVESELNVFRGNNIAIGIGYRFSKKIHLEARYNSERNLFARFSGIDTSYKTSSLIFGYSIF